MRLYVVNATGQHRIVNYRLDFTVDDQGRRISERLVPYKSIAIAPRAQMQFGGDMHITQIQEIISQLETTCAAVSVDQIRTAKARGVVKMVYSIDKSIPSPILKDVYEHNVGFLTEQGADRRRNLALAADANLTQLVERPLPKLEMDFEQMEDDPEGRGRLTEGLRIKHAEQPKPAPKRAGRRS